MIPGAVAGLYSRMRVFFLKEPDYPLRNICKLTIFLAYGFETARAWVEGDDGIVTCDGEGAGHDRIFLAIHP